MKSLAALLIACAALTGCVKMEDMPVTSQGYRVSYQSGSDICYDGIVYTQFGSAQSSWGGVKFDKETKQPITCGAKK